MSKVAKLLFLLSFISFSGCAIKPEMMERAEKACESHDGLNIFLLLGQQAKCNNGDIITLK